MKRMCGARLRKKPGQYCRRHACRGQLRCNWHGGAPHNGKHLSEPPDHRYSLARARAAKRWPQLQQNNRPGGLARTATANRLPNGRLAPGSKLDAVKPYRSSNRTIARAQRAGDRLMAKPSPAPAVAGNKPRAKMTKGEKLSVDTDRALDQVRKILDFEPDANDPKMVGHILTAASLLINAQLRVDENSLSRHHDQLERERERMLKEIISALPERPRAAQGRQPDPAVPHAGNKGR